MRIRDLIAPPSSIDVDIVSPVEGGRVKVSLPPEVVSHRDDYPLLNDYSNDALSASIVTGKLYQHQ